MERNSRRTLKGTVVSTKMDKTIIVLVENYVKFPKYGKRVLKSKKYKVHDEKGIAKLNDKVVIKETRSLSKDKYFRLKEINESR